MIVCNLCGFVAAERSTTGSMKLHALKKHGEVNYLSIFEEKTDERSGNDGGSTPKTEKKKASESKRDKKWRLLNKNDPRERMALADGYTMVSETGPDPRNWDLK